MELLKSEKFKLPTVFFITDRTRIKELPIGVPFIYGNKKDKQWIVRLLEYEILFQKAVRTGLPFNFKKILEDNGYSDLERFWWNHTFYMDYVSEEDYMMCDGDDYDVDKCTPNVSHTLSRFIKDSTVYVDITKLKELNVFPVWLDTIEQAVSTNIHNFAIYNPHMYNKKLEGTYGGYDLTSPNRNLIVIDISGSIPKGASSSQLALAKFMGETYYADILITGSKSTLYPYEELYKLNIDTIYNENGMDNDQVYFKKLVSSEKRNYKTAIVFGDNHSPCDNWNNEYNKNTRTISREKGKKLCKWSIDKLISFHTTSSSEIAGYADWFEPKEVEKISGWIKYLNN
jgi:hypothetical protein